MIKIDQWSQPNLSDKTGTIAYSKNLNLDEQGYLKLSPRTVTFYDEATSTNFGVPVDIARTGDGVYLINTSSNAVFDTSITRSAFTFSENDGTNNPTLTTDSRGCYFNNLWFASTDTTVVSKALDGGSGATWTDRITGLTSGKVHDLEVFKSRVSLCVTNGNVVQQVDSSYADDDTGYPDLTLPSDYECVGLAYNNQRMAVITRPASSATNQNAIFAIWDGATSSANQVFDLGSDCAIAIVPYKASYVVLTRTGELLYFNGGGFQRLATFPFYNTERKLSTALGTDMIGSSMMVNGDRIFINTCFEFNDFGRKNTRYMVENPSGVWCYDPNAGLYHRYSPSTSQVARFAVTSGNVDTTTNVMTVTSGTLPATGNPVRYTAATSAIGGLTVNNDYWLIKTGATTFKLATTKANALAGTAIDITSTGDASSFYIYDIYDYAATNIDTAGAIVSTGATNNIYQEVFFGADVFDTGLDANDSLCGCVPFLENRGYVVLPKVFSSNITDTEQKIVIRHRPLDTDDAIVVKVKREDVIGLPTVTPSNSNSSQGNWASPNIVYNTQDMSEAKTYFDAGGALEMEIISGAGAGTMVQIIDVAEDSGVYSFTLEEDVLGAASGRQCEFVVDNWEKKSTITASNAQPNNVARVVLGDTGKYAWVKIELRGFNTTIEDVSIINSPHGVSA